MRALALALVLALAGCSTAPRMPARALVPVALPCRAEVPPEPVWATGALTPQSDIFDQVTALLAERLQRRAYGQLLKTALEICVAAD